MTDSNQETWERVCDRLAEIGFEQLSSVERLWVSVRGLIDSIQDGGIPSYFYNSYADQLQECKRSLITLGSKEILAQVDRACSLFPLGVPQTAEARNKVIDNWEDTVDSTLEDIDRELSTLLPELEAKLDSYILKHLK